MCEAGKKPNFSQIYIYNQDNELDNRLKSFHGLDQDLLKELQDMMKEKNPYAQKYCHVGNIIKQNPESN